MLSRYLHAEDAMIVCANALYCLTMQGKAPVVIISELRQIAGDPGFLSPTPQDSISIHFTFGHHPVEVMGCVAQIEEALAPFNARPHWVSTLTRALVPDLFSCSCFVVPVRASSSRLIT